MKEGQKLNMKQLILTLQLIQISLRDLETERCVGILHNISQRIFENFNTMILMNFTLKVFNIFQLFVHYSS